MSDTRRSAVVTGASHGIGRAVAEHLMGLGYDLVVNARSGDKLVGLTDMASKLNVQVKAVPGDLRRSEVMDEIETAAAGSLDVVFIGTGAIVDPESEHSVLQLEDDRLKEIFNVTAVCPIDLYRRLAPSLRARHGTAFFIASDWVLPGSDGPSVFAAAKAAILHFVRMEEGAAQEVGIKMCCLVPGDIATYDQDWETPVWTLNDSTEDVLKTFDGRRISLHDVMSAVDFVLGCESARIQEIHMGPLKQPTT